MSNTDIVIFGPFITLSNIIQKYFSQFMVRKDRKMNSSITVHPLTKTPTAVWNELSKTQIFTTLPLSTRKKNPVEPGHIRIVCMSDTHSQNKNFVFKVPDGDIFIHAGDFTTWGQEQEVLQFNEWMKSLPHKHKIVIAGNHELTFDPNCFLYNEKSKNIKKILKDCTYLEDTAVSLYGLKIYGSPWQAEHGGLAFNAKRGEELLSKWNQIPEDTDILITHGPALGHGDKLETGFRAGCVELLSTIQNRVKPILHVFGHIHEGYGVSTDGTTVFINPSTCNRIYQPTNLPLVFDFNIITRKLSTS